MKTDNKSLSKKSRPGLKDTADIVLLLRDIRDIKQEHFIVFSFDSAGCLIAKRTVFIGTLTSVIAHPREVFADPISDHAAYIVVAHNHPSGDPEPSKQDITMTQQLIAAGYLLGVPLHNHVIVAGNEHFSFVGHGLI